jgi:hypothetical protein
VASGTGTALLIRGDLSRDRLTKQKVLHEGENPVTGLFFREVDKHSTLFITTATKVISVETTLGKDTKVR